ncbi:hypothetical protein V494_04010 [Pseudogymnoascus sp. VKM F-4513 (FW-928)]|nr:hypothetical protein V494_04010 [Pseudogymnoascus sp. VKM F-4513 (FW-928)]
MPSRAQLHPVSVPTSPGTIQYIRRRHQRTIVTIVGRAALTPHETTQIKTTRGTHSQCTAVPSCATYSAGGTVTATTRARSANVAAGGSGPAAQRCKVRRGADY